MGQFEDRVEQLFEDMGGQDVSPAVAAIKTLLSLIKEAKATTFSEQVDQLKKAVETMKRTSANSITSLNSSCELFMRFISNIEDERRDEGFEQCRKLMMERGDRFVNKVEGSRKKIAAFGSPHIKENAVLLVHSKSRVVLELLKAASKTKKFKVYVTESKPDDLGKEMVEDLKSADIDAERILDAAIGYIMERIDLVLVGAEGVLASGGIINKIGTFSIAMAAKAFNKPFYVAAESIKFSNLYPLNQQDLPNCHEYNGRPEKDPVIDYTPAEYITLLFTDIGILTPTAVSDELIKLA